MITNDITRQVLQSGVFLENLPEQTYLSNVYYHKCGNGGKCVLFMGRVGSHLKLNRQI
jgi:hypothetical protein